MEKSPLPTAIFGEQASAALEYLHLIGCSHCLANNLPSTFDFSFEVFHAQWHCMVGFNSYVSFEQLELIPTTLSFER